MASSARVDFLVIGAGIASLRAAVELADQGDVLVVTKESVSESNTHYAQGGIAVAMEGDEDVALHLADTLRAGDGLVYEPAAAVLVAEGPERVKELIEWGTRFDRDGADLQRTKEGAHSLPRILHANGDATGAEISRALAAFAHAHPRIRFAEWTTVVGLASEGGRMIGADLLDPEQGARRVYARSLLIAAGGAGQIYSDTTNPAVATGDGIAMAALAAAELADMEFYQFHPTALALEGVPRFLLSEALRGEGAYLRNDRGDRFMERYHPLLELAPRDVVARAIAREGLGDLPGAERPVYLDMRHVQGIDLHKRFPGISAFLGGHGLDLQRDLIPVRPAAHYLMGGIRTDLDGRSSVKGLYAAGEAACTGVHGANRLASNSLLEGLVYGARAAKAMLRDSPNLPTADTSIAQFTRLDDEDEQVVEKCIVRLRHSMWVHAGLLREKRGLLDGLRALHGCEADLEPFLRAGKMSRRLAEARALCILARAILQSALARHESRGAHFRNDFPQRDDQHFQKHSVYNTNGTTDALVAFLKW
ncbi:MAG TPA: L-aspartate oxidase [Terracidiphilus sp.]|nr:L-aspartate oxidase [Terracidiphilus sp.]